MYLERYIFKSSGTLGGSIALLALSLVLYRASTSPSITESSEYRCSHSCSILHSGCSKHNVKASKIFTLFRSTTMIESSALSATSWTCFTRINRHALSLWQVCKEKNKVFVKLSYRKIQKPRTLIRDWKNDTQNTIFEIRNSGFNTMSRYTITTTDHVDSILFHVETWASYILHVDT